MMPGFDYIRPRTVQEALEMLEKSGGNITILGGGTDVIPGIRQNSRRFQKISLLLDINHLTDLKKIYVENNHIHIGAAADFYRIAADPLIRGCLPLLADAAGRIGSVQIRNRATIGGNIVNNAPCADSVPPLLIYDAKIRLRSLNDQREVKLEDFLKGSYNTSREINELVTRLIIPLPGAEYRGEFMKLGRRRGVAVSRISLAVLASSDSGRIKDLRISSGAVTPVGVRLKKIEQFACDKEISRELLQELAIMAGQAVLEITGLRWSGMYKLPVLQQILYRMLCNVLEDAQ